MDIIYLLQVTTVLKILESNRLRPRTATLVDQATSTNSTASSSPDPAPSLSTSVPYKLLMTGKSVAVCLLPPRTPTQTPGSGGGQFSTPGHVAPVLVCLLHNPLCTFHSQGGKKWGVEGSLFDMAIGYNIEKCSLCK